MLKLALLFIVISVVADFFGFSGVPAAAAAIAEILSFIAVATLVVLLVLARVAGQAILRPDPPVTSGVERCRSTGRWIAAVNAPLVG